MALEFKALYSLVVVLEGKGRSLVIVLEEKERGLVVVLSGYRRVSLYPCITMTCLVFVCFLLLGKLNRS